MPHRFASWVGIALFVWGGVGKATGEGRGKILTPEEYAQQRATLKVVEGLTPTTVKESPDRWRSRVLEIGGVVCGRVEVSGQLVLILQTQDQEAVHLRTVGEKPPVNVGMKIKALARVPESGPIRYLELLGVTRPTPSEKQPSPPLTAAEMASAHPLPEKEPVSPAQPDPEQIQWLPPAEPDSVGRRRLSEVVKDSPAGLSQVTRPASPSPPPRRTSPQTSRGLMGRLHSRTMGQSAVEKVAAVIAARNPRVPPLERQYIAQCIVAYSQMQGLRWEFFTALIAAESNFDRYAVSKSGAQGLGQLMPGTAQELGVVDPFNIEQNLWGAVRYIRAQLDRFRERSTWDQFSLALACYNAGPGAVEKYGGVPPYAETNAFIRRVAQLYSALCAETGD